MRTLAVSKIINKAASQEDGIKLRTHIIPLINSAEPLVLDFRGISVFTTRFFNESIGVLILERGPDFVDNSIKLENLNQLGLMAREHSVQNARQIYFENKSRDSHEVNRFNQQPVDR